MPHQYFIESRYIEPTDLSQYRGWEVIVRDENGDRIDEHTHILEMAHEPDSDALNIIAESVAEAIRKDIRKKGI